MFENLRLSVDEWLWMHFKNICNDDRDAEKLAQSVADDVINDVKETADPQNWNFDDINIAFTRVLKKRLGVEE